MREVSSDATLSETPRADAIVDAYLEKCDRVYPDGSSAEDIERDLRDPIRKLERELAEVTCEAIRYREEEADRDYQAEQRSAVSENAPIDSSMDSGGQTPWGEAIYVQGDSFPHWLRITFPACRDAYTIMDMRKAWDAAKLDSKLSAPSAIGECEWSADDDGIYHTTCRNAFVFIDPGPKENKMEFCCYCGSKMKKTAYVE